MAGSCIKDSDSENLTGKNMVGLTNHFCFLHHTFLPLQLPPIIMEQDLDNIIQTVLVLRAFKIRALGGLLGFPQWSAPEWILIDVRGTDDVVWVFEPWLALYLSLSSLELTFMIRQVLEHFSTFPEQSPLSVWVVSLFFFSRLWNRSIQTVQTDTAIKSSPRHQLIISSDFWRCSSKHSSGKPGR